jgi:release factor glutamine methyltransferase
MFKNRKEYILKKYLPLCLIPYALKYYSKRMILLLKKGILLSKILKEKFFWKSAFKTTYNTLDPRGDSEMLIEIFLKEFQKLELHNPKFTIMDLCTGTGVLGISLLIENLKFFVYFVDISHKALQVCKYNIRAHQLWHKTKIIKESIESLKDIQVDFLISNPPYLLLEEINQNPILKQDPFIALYGGEDGLYFYHFLSNYIKKNIKYFACIEIDHYRHEQILHIFVKNNFQSVQSFKDYNDLYRILLIII